MNRANVQWKKIGHYVHTPVSLDFYDESIFHSMIGNPSTIDSKT